MRALLIHQPGHVAGHQLIALLCFFYISHFGFVIKPLIHQPGHVAGHLGTPLVCFFYISYFVICYETVDC